MLSTETSLGHGMDGELETKDWENLNTADIQRLQFYYPQLHGAIDITWNSPRPFSSAALIRVENQTFFVKRSHRSFRSAQDLMQEHLFISHLSKKQLRVPEILIANTGMSAIELDDWAYEIHRYSPSVDVYADTPSWKPFLYAEHAWQTGAMLANLHLAAQDYDVVVGRTARYLVSTQQLLESDYLVPALQTRIESSRALSDYFKDKTLDSTLLLQLGQIHQKIVQPLQACQKIWTHNDLHASNLLWDAEDQTAKIAAVIDFGLCDRTSKVYDFAITIERNFIDWLALKNSNDIQIDYVGLEQFLRGYAANMQTFEHFDIVPDLLTIVHVDFAMSELEYFVAITHNLSHADAAYQDWLIAHTAWFFRVQGQQFKQKLARLIQDILLK
ncbi:phosphotransferase enzyme family protein [Acinetobacter sp. MD2(2019)]|uniref:phosphotransferase enzyme family protein n=1 Tax=Acinetobacter sp. MD2(2019) TaxID=2605273 RepID=UPI002D1E5F1A|nr:phosphotransferase [Acinetobacter sp. MD2(2019)]MEB3754883.1 phosphotransferase [Acinetobacter sp. MD2(2019)]